MCTSTASGEVARATASQLVAASADLAATELADVLHGVLGHLLGADLTGLTSEQLASLVTSLVRSQHRAHAAVLDAVAAFDTADVASLSAHRTTKRWLEHRTKLSAGTAAYLTRTARVLRDHLPATRAELVRGAISAQHVATIARVVTTIGAEHARRTEPILLDLARRFEPSVVRRATAELFALVDPEGAEKALHHAYEKRGVTLSVVGQHGYLDGVLDVESTELLMAALQPLMTPAGPDDRRTTSQLRADALLDLAQHSLDSGQQPEMGNHRPHLSVVVDASELETGTGGVSLPWTGAVVPASVAQRWSCDAEMSPVLARLLPPPRAIPVRLRLTDAAGSLEGQPPVVGGGWHPLDVGRTARLATPAQVRALRVRDGGCIHPGCPRTAAYCHAHHVVFWGDGGRTDLSNLVLLCRHHHRTLHAGVWRLRPDPRGPGRFEATTPDGVFAVQSAADRSPPLRPAPPPLVPAAA